MGYYSETFRQAQVTKLVDAKATIKPFHQWSNVFVFVSNVFATKWWYFQKSPRPTVNTLEKNILRQNKNLNYFCE